MTTTTLQRVYVWEMPVRLFHWVNALAIAVLAVTGLILGTPPAFLSSAEAGDAYWFGTVRFVHFVAGFVFVFNLIPRLYWGLVGNRWARWNNYLPATPRRLREHWNSLVRTLRADILEIDVQPYETVGHNAVALSTYLALFLIMLFQAGTGLALYAPMSDWWFPGLFAWIVPLMGGDAEVRYWHHAALWVFVVFTIIHVYLVAFHDYVEGRGTLSSIIDGWKFIDTPRR